MKLEIEIKNDMVEYKYWFSESNHGGGSMPLDQGLLASFVNATHYCQNHYRHESGKRVDIYIDEAKSKAWVEKNPEACIELLKKVISK